MENSSQNTKIFALAILRHNGVSLLTEGQTINSNNIQGYTIGKENYLEAINALQSKGFTADNGATENNPLVISFSGTKDNFEKILSVGIESVELPENPLSSIQTRTNLFFSFNNDLFESCRLEERNSELSKFFEAIVLEKPYYLFSENSNTEHPESILNLSESSCFSLDDIVLACNAAKAHRSGFSGKQINVSVIDSGIYEHLFFQHNGYQISCIPQNQLNKTPNGHGTSVAANVLTIAPNAVVTMIKFESNDKETAIINSAQAFLTAMNSKPDIINCSWGVDTSSDSELNIAQKILHYLITFAIDKGIAVVCSSGNGGNSFPGQHPDVISVGGVVVDEFLEISVSSESSGFTSLITEYNDRKVPDLCGISGSKDKKIFILMPIQPDKNSSVCIEQTGWQRNWGTSFATAQVTGVITLMKEANNHLKPSEIKTILLQTATDVTKGTGSRVGQNSAPQASLGMDSATGAGLVNASAALQKVLDALNQQKSVKY